MTEPKTPEAPREHAVTEPLHADEWRDFFRERGWSIAMDDRAGQAFDPFVHIADVTLRSKREAPLRTAAERVVRATEANRNAINGVGHEGPHDRDVHMDPCTGVYGVHVYSTTSDCAQCGGAQYGTEDELHGAIGDLRAALGYERRPWEYER